MKTIRYTIMTGTVLVLLLLGDTPPDARFGLQLVPEAQAVLGVWRRHARRWAVVGTAAVATTATAAAATSAEQQAVAEQQAATAQQQAAAAQQQAHRPDGAPPLGSIAATLPKGCSAVTFNGVQYQDCAGVYYRAAFQGNNLVYVVSQP